MTEQEIERLAALIARSLIEANERAAGGSSGARSSGPSSGGTWLPNPVRPEPSQRGNDPPIWSGAAQDLSDVAPGVSSGSGSRVSTAEITNATRAAAAGGRGRPVSPTGAKGRVASGVRPRGPGAPPIDVSIGVSNRHIHLSPAHFQTLFGKSEPSVLRTISQPGQFAANETVNVVGPKGKIDGIRLVGPIRGDTQLEISLADARTLGIDVPIAASGALAKSAGGVTLNGAAGSVKLEKGVIVAARHLHLGEADGRAWGLRDGDRLDVRVGSGPRATTYHDVLVRSGPTHASELHVDADEAHAAGVRTGDKASIIAWRGASGAKGGRKTLITERDVVNLAKNGGRVPAGALLTPSARDRAKALGILVD
jgi:putative phosphotransacetylase